MRGAVVVLALVVTSATRTAQAHGLDPIGVSVREREAGDVRIVIDRPAVLAGGAHLAVELGPGCRAASPPVVHESAGRAREEHGYQCTGPLAGGAVTVAGLEAVGLDAIVRAELADGAVHRGIASANEPSLRLEEAPSAAKTAWSYFGLGAKHLALGVDHLLFVLGVACITRSPRRVALALTAFTLGHSVTLTAAALGWLRFPPAWAELGIAFTLVWLAFQVVRGGQGAAPLGRVAAASGAMGLVHGLGFATALAEAGLPERDVPLALFSFNVGVEAAQLAFVTLLYGCAVAAARLGRFDAERARPWVGHALGAIAAMWCIERALTL